MQTSYPRELVRHLRPEVNNLKATIAHHFKNRHAHGSAPAIMWVKALREFYANTGYLTALYHAQG